MISLWRLLPLVLVLGSGGDVLAQTFPSKPIRIVANMSAGGPVDTVARLISAKMADSLNQPVLVENRVGAGGNIGVDAVAKAAPDGYTILVTTDSLAISPSLYRNLPFDAVKDLAPVTQLIASMAVLVVSPKLPVSSVRELIALAKSKPGGLNYGHTGVGSSLQLQMELF
ncbi:MAG: hypothetical protein HYU75_18370 [Betaproteobacteria bacterium]|nr:hypothetical protein [Betaproteobacteria bacterium]